MLEPLFRGVLEAQEADRLSAITMLEVLNELVFRADAERVGKRARSPASEAQPDGGGTTVDYLMAWSYFMNTI